MEEGMRAEEAGALLVLMLREGDSGFGVEEADKGSIADVLTPFRPFMIGPGASLLWEKARCE